MWADFVIPFNYQRTYAVLNYKYFKYHITYYFKPKKLTCTSQRKLGEDDVDNHSWSYSRVLQQICRANKNITQLSTAIHIIYTVPKGAQMNAQDRSSLSEAYKNKR